MAGAANHNPEEGAVSSFSPLPQSVAQQNVPLGTELWELDLPETVEALVYHVTEEEEIPEEDSWEEDNGVSVATLSNASDNRTRSKAQGRDESKTTDRTIHTARERIPVTWDSSPAFDGGTAGTYVFTADIGSNIMTSEATPPQISVTVENRSADPLPDCPPETPQPCPKAEGCTLSAGHEGECVLPPPANMPQAKTIISWKFVDDEYLNQGKLSLPGGGLGQTADFDTVVSMLPTQISAVIDEKQAPETLDILRWDCPEFVEKGDGGHPVSGEYTFTAALQAEYSCDPLPAVQVSMEGASLLTDASITWDGLANAKASELGAEKGDTIVITGSPFSGNISCLTIDEENITVTSAGNPVSDVNIDIESTVHSLTIKDLDLTSANKQVAVYFRSESSASVLKAEGTCSIAAKRINNLSRVIRSMNGLTLEVGDASMTVTGSQSTDSAGGNMGVYADGSLTVNVGSGGTFTARCPVMSSSMSARALSADSITINN